MSCEHALQRLRDLVDRELDEAEARRVEEHCAECTDCAAGLAAERGLKRIVRDRVRAGPAPAGLSGAIARRVREEAGRPGAGRPWWRSRLAGVAAAAAVLLGVALGFHSFFRSGRTPAGGTSPSAMAAELVDDHIRYLGVKEPTEVATADRAEAERWFAPRLGVPVTLPRFDEGQTKLLGGRLCYVLDRRVALLFYEREGRRLSLFVMDGQGLPEAPPPEKAETLERAVEEAKGYGVTCWTKEGRMYALVADVDRAGLARIVSAAYRE